MKDYQKILQKHLTRRQQLNPSYSKRAFARDINISPGSLVNILSGRFRLSIEKGDAISMVLGFSESEKTHFMNSVSETLSESKRKRVLEKNWHTNHDKQKVIINAKMNHILSSCYHLAVVEWFNGAESKWYSVKRISAATGLQISVVGEILEDLKEVSFIEKNSCGHYKLPQNTQLRTLDDDKPSEVDIQFFHKHQLSIASKALKLKPIDREFQALLINCQLDKLNHYKQKIKKFFDDLEKEIEIDNKSKESKEKKTMMVAMQLYPIFEAIDGVEDAL